MSDRDILKDARAAFDEAEATEKDNRSAALDDLKFARLGGEYQWPAKVRKQRETEGRPCLTINRMPSFIRQVVNDSRQNKPGIEVHPVESGDVKTAEVMSGLIRNIEAISNADVAYDTGVEQAVDGGFGYWRVNLEYATDDTFDKDILIKAVPNRFAIYGDPYSQCADSSDWNTAFVIEELSKAAFERKYPRADKIDFTSNAWNEATGWCNRETEKVRTAEFWRRDEVTRNIVQYTHDQTGEVSIAYEDELPALQARYPGFEVIGQPRPVKTYKVTQYTLNGLEVLSKTDWAGKYIPIIPVYGDEVNVEGKRHFLSLIRHARDPQQMANFWKTMATEMVALAPKVPWVGEEGAFSADARWATANNATHAFLEFKKGTPPPTRQPFTSLPAGELQMALTSSDDMKSVLGIYDASLGQRSNETSGRAIMARQHEGDVSTFHFIDNLSRAIRHTGKILIDLIPKVYTTDRVIRVLGQDGKPQTVRLTDGEANPAAGIYNLSAGKYDLSVKAGASYTTQREKALDMLTEVVRANPDSAALLGDLILELMDIPGGDKAIKRLQAMLPPQAKEAEQQDNPEAAQAQAQIQQLQQTIEQGMARMQELEASNEADKRKMGVEEYKAVTDRLSALNGMVTPELLQNWIIQTQADLDQTAALIPGGDMPQGMPMPMPGAGGMPEPMGQPA